MDKLFQIGSFCFRLICGEGITPPPNFMQFQVERGEPEFTYELTAAEGFSLPEGKLIAQRPDLTVLQTAQGECRLLGVKGRPGFYACYRELAGNRAQVALAPERLMELNADPVFTSLLALEVRLLERDGLILHCAYIEDSGEAIVFSAPSETGKTTQANLWEQYRGSRTVNGDRALLQQVDGRWAARGWPVCGTSEVCHNETIPIRAIVLLSQGRENRVERLGPARAFPLLFSQITANRWNRARTERTMELIEALLGQVPVFHLSCTISQEAVTCLAQALEGIRQ